jgi:hypothetical protein
MGSTTCWVALQNADLPSGFKARGPRTDKGLARRMHQPTP